MDRKRGQDGQDSSICAGLIGRNKGDVLLLRNGQHAGCKCDEHSPEPVRYFNGEVQLQQTDLSASGFGRGWGRQRGLQQPVVGRLPVRQRPGLPRLALGLLDVLPTEAIALMCNGYFASWSLKRQQRMWPLPSNVRPLYVGFHAADQTIAEGVHQGRDDWPVGCRDWHTLRLMRDNGLRCYWSGCLTLLLEAAGERSKDVVITDIAEKHLEQIPFEVRRQARFVSHHLRQSDPENRFAAAREMIATYASARLVITSRLHAMLPCAAFGTPVVLIKPTNADAERRFSGYEHLAWTPEIAPWHEPYPRLAAAVVHSCAAPARLAVASFLESLGY